MTETERTGYHRKVESWLERAGINFESEYDSFPPYSLDIYLPEWHLAIEVDGPYHLQKADRRRDEFLWDTYGIPTLRMKLKSIRKNAVLARVKKFIEEYAGSVEERKLVRQAEDRV